MTTITPTKPIIIDRAGLSYAIVPVSAESTVELVQHDAGANLWYALVVDGAYYHDLVMWKHTVGRPELMDALDQALADVQAAIIALLVPAPTILCPLGCGRQVATEQDEIHFCLTRNADGSKSREYVGTWDGAALFYGACYDEVERQLRPYREEQLASDMRYSTTELDGGDPEAVEPVEPDRQAAIDRLLAIEPDASFLESMPTAAISEAAAYAERRERARIPVCTNCGSDLGGCPDCKPLATPDAQPVAPSARLIPCQDLNLSDPAVIARLALMSKADLDWQAAVFAAYRGLKGRSVTTEQVMADFRRAIALHRSGAAQATPDPDDLSPVLFELALTDGPALIELLRGHTDIQREQLAWRFAGWLRREHGVKREWGFILRGWQSLIVGAAASGGNGTGRAQARPKTDKQGQAVQHDPPTSGRSVGDITTAYRK